MSWHHPCMMRSLVRSPFGFLNSSLLLGNTEDISAVQKCLCEGSWFWFCWSPNECHTIFPTPILYNCQQKRYNLFEYVPMIREASSVYETKSWPAYMRKSIVQWLLWMATHQVDSEIAMGCCFASLNNVACICRCRSFWLVWLHKSSGWAEVLRLFEVFVTL